MHKAAIRSKVPRLHLMPRASGACSPSAIAVDTGVAMGLLEVVSVFDPVWLLTHSTVQRAMILG